VQVRSVTFEQSFESRIVRMAVLVLCLSVLFVSVIANTPIVHGRSLRQHHGHHSHPNYYDFEESASQDPSGRLEDDLVYNDSYKRKPESHEYSRILNRLRNREPSRRQDLRRYDVDGYEGSSVRFFARKKRHNKHVKYETLTEENKRDLTADKISRIDDQEFLHNGGDLHTSYEMEVKAAQNSTICSYTVESIPIPHIRGTRQPKDLEHVRCNHIGCQDADPYCCIQTYRNVEVSYGDGYRETIKIYVGCVCAHRHRVLLTESQLPINE